ncbi:hypothetical protein HU200_051207 [Digitaria exilis]|uniref:MATH domain-containing protein n=1 Tax=Digitaria exilis TaxID=1010633 RepID=A0A835ANC6_9POAL|nr:hypothetical protein HU200_051207 [Digitaria exilis]
MRDIAAHRHHVDAYATALRRRRAAIALGLVLRRQAIAWTKSLPAGERITSTSFTVGGRHWQIDYYPNGVDPSAGDESDSVALYLRLIDNTAVAYHQRHHKERVRAQYKFSLLDLAGNAAFELPVETGVFVSSPASGPNPGPMYGHAADPTQAVVGCGYAAFISREEMERRRDSLLAEDCLLVRSDVGVAEVAAVPNNPSAAARRVGGYDPWYDYSDYGGGEAYVLGGGAREGPPLDDKEFIRRCLGAKRARK